MTAASRTSALSFELIVLGAPAPQGSKSYKGKTKAGKPILAESSKAVAPWRESIVWWARQASEHLGGPMTGPLRVRMVFTLARPRSAPKRRLYPDARPDLSKLARAVEDALTDAGVWADDACVVEYDRLAKVYAGSGDPDALDVPGVRVVVNPVGPGRAAPRVVLVPVADELDTWTE